MLNRHFLKISIGERTSQSPDNTWPVVAELYGPKGSERSAPGQLQLPTPDKHPDLIPAYGRQLGEALFSGAIRDLLNRAAGKVDQQESPHAHVPVMLQVKAESLRTQPWGRLEAPIGSDWRPLALSTLHPLVMLPTSHRLEDRQALPLPSQASPFQLLTLIANPADLTEATSLAPLTPQVEGLTTVPEMLKACHTVDKNASLAALDQQLQAKRFHMVHLVCHGGFVQSAGEVVLYLAHPQDGTVQPVRAGVFLEWLKERPGQLPQILFLTMCDSAHSTAVVREHNPLGEDRRKKVSPVTSPANLAERLVTEVGIPLVIGMEGKLPLEAGPILIQHFLKGLTEHGSPALALAEARQAYRKSVLPQRLAHSSPVLEAFQPVLYTVPDRYLPLEDALQRLCLAGASPAVRSSAQLPGPKSSARSIRETGARPGISVSSPPAQPRFAELNLAYRCDRQEQWDQLSQANRGRLDCLLVLPGSEREGHRYFNGRLKIAGELRQLGDNERPAPRVIQIRPCADSAGIGLTVDELLSQLIRTLSHDVKALGISARSMSQSTPDERLRTLLSALLHQDFILVHETYHATEANLTALTGYYRRVFECLSTLRQKQEPGTDDTFVLCFQPLEWRYASPVWSWAAQLLRLLNITPGFVRSALESWNLRRFLPEQRSPQLPTTHLPTLAPITPQHVQALKDLKLVKDLGIITPTRLDTFVQETFRGAAESRRVLEELERLCEAAAESSSPTQWSR